MILPRIRRIDKIYHPWFAWRPVRLNGPVEWNRTKRTGERERWAWLETLWRMRNRNSTYYMLREDEP